MNDLEFFDLGIYEFEQQLINCVGKPSRCNEPASQVIQALNDKPPFCRIKRKIIVLLHLPFLLWYSAIIISKEVAQIECANKILKKLFVCEMKYMCFCRLIHCFMKSVISTRTTKSSFTVWWKSFLFFTEWRDSNSPLSPQRDANSPVDCLRGCGRIRARLPHRALWTVPRQNSPRKNSQRANQQSHSRIFLKIFPRPSTKICQEHFQPLAATSLFHHQ